MENPFKFGSIVEGKFFTDRAWERDYLRQIIDSPNHAVLISPRRFGKSSLVAETLRGEKREVISVNMQAITSSLKLAEALYRCFFSIHPVAKAKHFLSHARVVPMLSFNPATGVPEASLMPGSDRQVALEDAFAMLEKAGEKQRLIVVFDEFQEIIKIEKGLDKVLRSIMQEQKNINYILMGSREDMMKQIFLRKKSPFYHFGMVMHLDRIPADDFQHYITARLPKETEKSTEIAKQILEFTFCHPYYTQQLAFQVWYGLQRGVREDEVVNVSIGDIVRAHDFDYSRLWDSMNNTNRAVLLKLATGEVAPLEQPDMPTSTIFSALKRLVSSGILIKNGKYAFDDPFFKQWISRL